MFGSIQIQHWVSIPLSRRWRSSPHPEGCYDFRFRLNFQSCHVTSTKSKKKKGAKSEMHIPYRDSVLTWLLRENLGKIIYPKYTRKTKIKVFFSNFHGQKNMYAKRLISQNFCQINFCQSKENGLCSSPHLLRLRTSLWKKILHLWTLYSYRSTFIVHTYLHIHRNVLLWTLMSRVPGALEGVRPVRPWSYLDFAK